ncbi:MAG TPA: very short patch repair endonuclease [Phycisphaerae bacterium]|nr:very short patch repair endonuclease [Phycisphaerae bacterium]
MTRSEIMKRVKQRNSGAEVALRSALFARGLRFRLHRRIEGVTIDIAFLGAKVAVLVDGCFWHGCPEHATYPKTNTAYWLPKLKENKNRDRRQTARLEAAGWTVVRVWEHECRPADPRVVARIATACGRPSESARRNGRSQ